MTNPKRIAVGSTGLIFALLSLSAAVVAAGQNLTEEQRQKERCENNRNRLAELEQLNKILRDRIKNIWSEEKEEKARGALQEIKRLKAPDQELEYLDRIPDCGDRNLDFQITTMYRYCLIRLGQPDDPASAPIALKKTCLNALYAGLGRAIQDAVGERERRSEMNDQVLDIVQQIQNHRVNLSALGCDVLGGAFNLTGKWSLIQGTDKGWLWLSHSGTTLTGTMMWLIHSGKASIQVGTFANGSVEIEVEYSTGEAEIYRGTVDASGKSIKGRVESVTRGSHSDWSATWLEPLTQ